MTEERPPAGEHTGGNVCVECGGGECGLHPAGCVYGGFTVLTGYWLVAEGCDLNHQGAEPDDTEDRRWRAASTGQ